MQDKRMARQHRPPTGEESLQFVSSLGNFLQNHQNGLLYVYVMSKQLPIHLSRWEKLLNQEFLCVCSNVAEKLADSARTFSPVFLAKLRLEL